MKTKFFLVLFLSITPCLSAVAQQATDTLAPTMPGKGNLVVRPILKYYNLKPSEQNLFSGTVLESAVHFDYGLTGATSLMLHVSEERQNEDQEKQVNGFTDLKMTFKWRFYQDDFGPVDTFRLGFLAGIEMPTGSSEFTSNSTVPFVGLSAMYIEGRHGVTSSAVFHATDGDFDDVPVLAGEKNANHIAFNAAYLYRIKPEAYSQDLVAAWYIGAELIGDWESDDDIEILLAPILLYEAPSWAFEMTYGIPIYEDVNFRPETDYTLSLGLRFLF
jgi:hypothetical protein